MTLMMLPMACQLRLESVLAGCARMELRVCGNWLHTAPLPHEVLPPDQRYLPTVPTPTHHPHKWLCCIAWRLQKMGIHGSGEVVVDEEDADLAAAIAASLAPQASSPALAGGAGASASSDAAVPAQHGTAMKLAVLQNDVGQYNCFLNVIVQCLWHCREFRQQVNRTSLAASGGGGAAGGRATAPGHWHSEHERP